MKLVDRPMFLNPPPSTCTSKERSPRGSEARSAQVKVGMVSSSGVVLVRLRGLEGSGGTAALGVGASMGVGVGIGVSVKEPDTLVVVESKVNWGAAATATSR